MRFEALLRAHGFMKVERPPEIWEGETDDVRFIPLLGEMIAAALSHGTELAELTLNASNVVVPPDAVEEGRGPAAGEYVAISVSGRTNLGPDSTWNPGGPASGLFGRIEERLITAGVRYAYVRSAPPNGSVTVFLSRVASPPDPSPA